MQNCIHVIFYLNISYTCKDFLVKILKAYIKFPFYVQRNRTSESCVMVSGQDPSKGTPAGRRPSPRLAVRLTALRAVSLCFGQVFGWDSRACVTRRWPQQGRLTAPVPPVSAEVAFPLRHGLGPPPPAGSGGWWRDPGAGSGERAKAGLGGDCSAWIVEPTLPWTCLVEAGLGVQASGSERWQHRSGRKTF